MRLQNKVIVITGGAQGIGAAIAQRCAREGAQVVIWDLRREAVDTALAHLADIAPDSQLMGDAVDVSRLRAVQEAAQAVLARFGHIDGLVNNAGIVADAQLKKMSEDQWDRVININLKGVFNCTRAFVDAFLEQGSGSIVNISSVVGVYGNFGQTNYAAAKAGVIGMTKTWAKELGRKGVRANAICPGFVQTPILDSMPPEVIDKMVAQVPLKRLAQPDEIATVAAFLLSSEASYVNGIAMEVTGGLVI
jgi:3-oxoacyl-[acyl-carrier protein] reductase